MVQRRVKINGGTHIFFVFWEKLVRSSKQIQGRYAEVQLFCRQELKGKVGFGTAKGQNQWRYAHLFRVLGKLVRSSKQIQGRYAEVQLFCRQELKGKVGFGTAKGQNQWRYAHLFRVLGKTGTLK